MELPRIYSALNHLKLYSIHGTNSGCVGMVVDEKGVPLCFTQLFKLMRKGYFAHSTLMSLFMGKKLSIRNGRVEFRIDKQTKHTQ